MKKRNLRILLGILFAISFCFICGRLYGFIDPLGLEEHPDVILKKDEYYAFDPQTILQDAVEGKPAQLTLVPGEPEIQPSDNPVVPWRQADYFQIVDAIYLAIWGETPTNWKLEQFEVQTNCTGLGLGYQRMDLTFYRIFKDETTGKYLRKKRDIFIIPEKELIWVRETEIFPVSPLELRDIGLDVKTIIPAEEALRIVEENGGRTARAGIDECTISATVHKGANDDNWLINYFSNHSFLMLEVDAKTGQIR